MNEKKGQKWKGGGKNKTSQLHRVEADLFCQHMGAQLGQGISKPLWTVDRCNPSPAVLMSSPILSLSQARSDQTVTCGQKPPCLQDADEDERRTLSERRQISALLWHLLSWRIIRSFCECAFSREDEAGMIKFKRISWGGGKKKKEELENHYSLVFVLKVIAAINFQSQV